MHVHSRTFPFRDTRLADDAWFTEVSGRCLDEAELYQCAFRFRSFFAPLHNSTFYHGVLRSAKVRYMLPRFCQGFAGQVTPAVFLMQSLLFFFLFLNVMRDARLPRTWIKICPTLCFRNTLPRMPLWRCCRMDATGFSLLILFFPGEPVRAVCRWN
jgi:hypothetical protein